jgi:hypothetical protein
MMKGKSLSRAALQHEQCLELGGNSDNGHSNVSQRAAFGRVATPRSRLGNDDKI